MTVARSIENNSNMSIETQLKGMAKATDKAIEALEKRVKELEKKLSEMQD